MDIQLESNSNERGLVMKVIGWAGTSQLYRAVLYVQSFFPVLKRCCYVVRLYVSAAK